MRKHVRGYRNIQKKKLLKRIMWPSYLDRGGDEKGTRGKRWSKLQREVYLIRADGLDFQIQCRVNRWETLRAHRQSPRYWITLGKEIIWDYPKDFIHKERPEESRTYIEYPWNSEVSKISDLIREYLDTPKSELMSKYFENDLWGLINILRATDRRIGQRRLKALRSKTRNKAARKVIEQRMRSAHTADAE
jgi:hypothetical protein